MNGFTLFYKGSDVFFVASRKRKNRKLATEILLKLQEPDSPANIDIVLSNLRKATCEVKKLSNGNTYVSIKGDGFTISDPEGKTKIIEIAG